MKQTAALILPPPPECRLAPAMAFAGGCSLRTRSLAVARAVVSTAATAAVSSSAEAADFPGAGETQLAAWLDGLDAVVTDVLLLREDAPLLLRETLRTLVERRREGNAPAAYLASGNEPVVAVFARDFLAGSLGTLATPGGAKAASGAALIAALLVRAPSDRLLRQMASDGDELLLISTPADLAHADAVLRRRAVERAIAAGAALVRPDTVTLDDEVILSPEVVLEPYVTLTGPTRVGRGTRIGQGCVVDDSVFGENVTVKPYCVIERSRVSDGAIVGPFARLREGTELGEGVHVGNFVETKKARLARGVKANHLTYLGDVVIGERTNVGAGVITCNYDGFAKHETRIGADVFVGSDTQLVAPVSVGDGAILGAGTTVTRDVPANALALARAPQENREGQATAYREKKRLKRGGGKGPGGEGTG